MIGGAKTLSRVRLAAVAAFPFHRRKLEAATRRRPTADAMSSVNPRITAASGGSTRALVFMGVWIPGYLGGCFPGILSRSLPGCLLGYLAGCLPGILFRSLPGCIVGYLAGCCNTFHKSSWMSAWNTFEKSS